MMLVPQKPYMALGSLRQQLLYPVFAGANVAEALDGGDSVHAKDGLLDDPVAPAVGARASSIADIGSNTAADPEKAGVPARATADLAQPPPSSEKLSIRE
eukprot:jgi/Ulvmu1/5703/UM024_0052.1